MTQNNNSWKRNYFTLLIGQGVSFISSGILQMAIIFYLVAKTNSAIILTIATLIGFLPQACLGPFAGVFVDRHSRKGVMIGADLMIAAAGDFWLWPHYTRNCLYGQLWSCCLFAVREPHSILLHLVRQRL